MPHLPGGGRRDCPAGRTVNLVGIGDGNQWWRPDGTPLTEPPIRIENPSQPADKNFKRREFLLDIQNLPDKSSGYAAEIVPGTATNIPKQFLLGKNGQQFPNGINWLAFETAVPASSEILTVVRCGVATGPWKESSSPSVNFSGTSISGGGSMRQE